MATYLLAVPSTPPKNGRRSANFLPPICNDDFIQSLKSDYGEVRYIRQADNLKNYARNLLEDEEDTFSILELIDTLERLGVSYHFEEEIKRVIEQKLVDAKKEDDLQFTSLKFRILRQHGHMISQDEFIPFLDEKDAFKEVLSQDTKGILTLYDASYLAMEGERVLDTARAFTSRHLRDHLKGSINSVLHELVERGLELPYYWRPRRLEARWFIDIYERMENTNPKLLEFAKVDYNICQARYQSNVKAVSRWWKNHGLAEYLPFYRDRLPECFLWGLGMVSRPQDRHAIERLTIMGQLVTILDDIYDIYGKIEELELFTNEAVQRWDVQVLDELPNYMRLYYLFLLNFVQEMGYTTLKQQGCNIIPFLKKLWGDLCKAYLVESKWLYQGYKPTFDEYINNAWVTIGMPAISSSTFFLMNQEMTEERFALLHNYSDLIQNQALAIRLLNDLDEQEKRDVINATQCYMSEKGVSQQAACEHVKHMINESWKRMNKHLILGATFPKDFVTSIMDSVRIAQCFYMYGDGFTYDRTRARHVFMSLVVEPIELVDEYSRKTI